jgi:NADPH-dependent curcumin reductase CurA
VVFDYANRYPAAVAELSGWLAEGQLTSVEETVRENISAFPSTLLRLFSGHNTGKLVLELAR